LIFCYDPSYFWGGFLIGNRGVTSSFSASARTELRSVLFLCGGGFGYIGVASSFSASAAAVARTGEGGRGTAVGFGSALPTQRQGRAIRGRAAHRARTRARRAAKCGQFSGASNKPMFAAIGARGAAPRWLQCARDADAKAGSRHTRPRGSQGAHAGAPGGKMRAFLRRIQNPKP
jgi:hypothetical protein